MDSLQFDSYTSYSDDSNPRTPSPRTAITSDDMQFASPPHYKQAMDLPTLTRNIFADNHDQEMGIVPEQGWHPAYHSHYPSSQPSSRGSLLEELYDHDIPDHNVPQDVYVDCHQQHGNGWAGGLPQTAHGEHHMPHSVRHIHDVAMTRRATFPYVRQDRGDAMSYSPAPPFLGDHDSLGGSPYSSRPSTMYSEPLSIDSPHAMCEPLQGHMYDEPFAHTVPMNSPHPPYHDYRLDGIKTEDSVPVIVPSQNQFCRPPSAGMHPLPCLSPHAGILVQHTDDAASKETQYLRRRCFNCHTTEPPSWRRSTLNPGKIVCNKCGLYERTHLRPRPLRFDELRAGSKTRKQPKVGGSPKSGKMLSMVKKEPEVDGIMPRRSSVSSSSASSASGNSDWDDNVSVYSSGSAPPSSFNSPSAQTFPIPREHDSQSPPLAPQDGGIRLPNAPLSDIASLQSEQSPHLSPSTPRKSATAPTPVPYYPNQPQSEYFARRGSLPVPAELQRRHTTSLDVPIPEVTGWQSVPLSDLSSTKAIKPRSDSLRKAVAV